MKALVDYSRNGEIVQLRLNRPERHNALVPELLASLQDCLRTAKSADPAALILTGNGKSFSTGGDIGGFLDHAQTDASLLEYSDHLVGKLHEIVLELLCLPFPVIAAVNGPVTGGSLGLVLASDLVVMAEHAFLQPYYSEVGFGPDGGWTALLPERIGAAKTLEIQYLNRRVMAAEAVELGIANFAMPMDQIGTVVDDWTAGLTAKKTSSLRATRAGVWDEARLAQIRQRLDNEKQRFLENITLKTTREGMETFVGR